MGGRRASTTIMGINQSSDQKQTLSSGVSLRRRLTRDHRQAGGGEYRQVNVPVPAIPPATSYSMKTHLHLTPWNHSSIAPRASPHLPVPPGRSRRPKAHTVSQLLKLANTPTSQQPGTLVGLLQGPDRRGCPVVDPKLLPIVPRVTHNQRRFGRVGRQQVRPPLPRHFLF